MHTRSRLLLGSLVVAVALGAMIATAPANRLSITERAFRITWAPMEIGLQPEPAIVREGITIKDSCNVTMEGSFHSGTIVKVAGALIGYVTRASVDGSSCVEQNGGGGRFRFLTETLPWHIRYAGFTGTLPNIAIVRINYIGMAVDVTNPMQNCLSRSTATEPAGWRIELELEHTGLISTFLAEEQIILPRPTGTGCVGYLVYYQGRGRYTRLGTTEHVTVTLI